jgi:hypothetical protein
LHSVDRIFISEFDLTGLNLNRVFIIHEVNSDPREANPKKKVYRQKLWLLRASHCKALDKLA